MEKKYTAGDLQSALTRALAIATHLQIEATGLDGELFSKIAFHLGDLGDRLDEYRRADGQELPDD